MPTSPTPYLNELNHCLRSLFMNIKVVSLTISGEYGRLRSRCRLAREWGSVEWPRRWRMWAVAGNGRRGWGDWSLQRGDVWLRFNILCCVMLLIIRVCFLNYCAILKRVKTNPDAGVEGQEADPTDLLLLCGDNSPTLRSSPPPPPTSPSPRSSPSPSKPEPPVQSYFSTGRSQRGRVVRGQLFDDPAVVKTVEGRPSLKVHLLFWCLSACFSFLLLECFSNLYCLDVFPEYW